MHIVDVGDRELNGTCIYTYVRQKVESLRQGTVLTKILTLLL